MQSCEKCDIIYWLGTTPSLDTKQVRLKDEVVCSYKDARTGFWL